MTLNPPYRPVEPSALSATRRAGDVSRLCSERFDVLVIGGGVTGCGIALDAATRGLSVGLVEKGDLASGTSGRSGKLIHGGLRYLEQARLGLVRESLRERALLLEALAPHLVRPIEFVLPLHHAMSERAYVGLGLLLYDTIGGAGALPRHHHLSRSEALELAPGLARAGLTGAFSFYDAQVDDARHTLALARTAAAHGAAIVTRASATGLVRDTSGRVRAVRVLDQESRDELVCRADHVIAATGVWSGELVSMTTGVEPPRLKASKGVHLMVRGDAIDAKAAILTRAEDSVLFLRPFLGHWLVGTTDTAWPFDLDDPAATSSDVEYLLRNANRCLERPLGRGDVVGVYAGLRPLVAKTGTSRRGATTSKLSREHAVTSPLPGLTVVTGGKYTTYRVMAGDALDHTLRETKRSIPRGRSDEVPLVGAAGRDQLAREARELTGRFGLEPSSTERLVARHGLLATSVLEQAGEDETLREKVPGAPDYLLAEARYAATDEGALHLEDVLERRMHASIATIDRGLRAARAVVTVVGDALGWDEQTRSLELARYGLKVRAERLGEGLTSDEEANAARAGIRSTSTTGT